MNGAKSRSLMLPAAALIGIAGAILGWNHPRYLTEYCLVIMFVEAFAGLMLYGYTRLCELNARFMQHHLWLTVAGVLDAFALIALFLFLFVYSSANTPSAWLLLCTMSLALVLPVNFLWSREMAHYADMS